MGENGSHRITPILLLLAALIIAGTILIVGHDSFSQSAATVVAIAKMEIGTAPADFLFTRTGQGPPGQWTVVADEKANGDCVIEQSSTDRTDYRFPLAIYNPIVAKTVDVSVSFRPVAGASIRLAALPCASSMPTTITLRAPMALRTTSVSIVTFMRAIAWNTSGSAAERHHQ